MPLVKKIPWKFQAQAHAPQRSLTDGGVTFSYFFGIYFPLFAISLDFPEFISGDTHLSASQGNKDWIAGICWW